MNVRRRVLDYNLKYRLKTNGIFLEDMKVIPESMMNYLFLRRHPFPTQATLKTLAEKLKSNSIGRAELEEKLGTDSCWFFITEDNRINKFPDWECVSLPSEMKKMYESGCKYLSECGKDEKWLQIYLDKLDLTVREEALNILADRKANCQVTYSLIKKLALTNSSFLQIIQIIRNAMRFRPKGITPKVETYLENFREVLLKHKVLKFEIRQVELKFVRPINLV